MYFDRRWKRRDYPQDFSFFEHAMCDPLLAKFALEKDWTEWAHSQSEFPRDNDARIFALICLELMIKLQKEGGACALITTANGYLARVEKEVQAEDILCSLRGCNQTAVLRPCRDSGAFRLVDVATCPETEDDHWAIPCDAAAEERTFVLV